MSVYVQTNQPIQLQDADSTISATDTGKIMLVPVLTANRIIALPTLAAGLHYRFMNSASAAGPVAASLAFTATIRPTPAANRVEGTLVVNNANVANIVSKNNAASAILTDTSLTGDYIDVYCDGTFWHVNGMSRVAAGLA